MRLTVESQVAMTLECYLLARGDGKYDDGLDSKLKPSL